MNVMEVKKVTEHVGVDLAQISYLKNVGCHFDEGYVFALLRKLICHFAAGQSATDDGNVVANLAIFKQILLSI